jgi:membrane protein YqaA with SNARE-associated domain
MNFGKVPVWLRALVSALGGAGLFVAAFLDSSVLSFPVLNDLLLIQLSVQHPLRMPYYALLATSGSVAGCLLLYFLAAKGGEVMFRRRAGARAGRIRDWVNRNSFLSLAIPSILPPPLPFKAFVIAAGVFGMPRSTFVIALVAGRGLRYFGEGFLAVHYRAEASRYLAQHTLQFTLIVVGLVLLGYLVSRLIFREGQP